MADHERARHARRAPVGRRSGISAARAGGALASRAHGWARLPGCARPGLDPSDRAYRFGGGCVQRDGGTTSIPRAAKALVCNRGAQAASRYTVRPVDRRSDDRRGVTRTELKTYGSACGQSPSCGAAAETIAMLPNRMVL